MPTIKGSYEAVMIFSMTLGEEGVAAMVTRFKDLIAQNGDLGEVDEWGKRKLAFEVDKLTEGDYTLINFHADPNDIAELDRVLRINDAVKRHMVVCRPVED